MSSTKRAESSKYLACPISLGTTKDRAAGNDLSADLTMRFKRLLNQEMLDAFCI